MKMTTRGRYGLRAMLELARCFGEPPLLMSTLAKRERLSRKYLHALLAAMKSAGLVCSVRGAGGGFRLSRPPAEIRLSEILHAVEGPLSLVECVSRPAACNRSSRCTARHVWQTLSSKIEQILEGITLQDLVATEPSSVEDSGRRDRPQARRRGTPRETGDASACSRLVSSRKAGVRQ